MESLAQSDIFFFIATIGFSLLALLAAVALCYLILILARFHRIGKRLEELLKNLGSDARAVLSSLRKNPLLSWLWKRAASKRKK